MSYLHITQNGGASVKENGLVTIIQASSGGETRDFIASSDLSIIFTKDDRGGFIPQPDTSIFGINP